VQVIGGAVERVDDPARAVAADIALRAALLTQDGVIRVGAADDLDDASLGLAIGFAHEVVRTLALDTQLMQTLAGAKQEVAGSAGGAHGYGAQWGHADNSLWQGPPAAAAAAGGNFNACDEAARPVPSGGIPRRG
jgi:hypothetical protein